MVDYLVIGSGIAGLSFALHAASIGSVTIITKKKDTDSATNLAQGGIAAVLSASDDFNLHIQDTLDSGAGLCDKDVVDFVVKEGPQRVKELMEAGVQFVNDKDHPGKLDLGKEGGHSRRRVAHAYDLTGKEIERALLAKAKSNSNITILENHTCIDLICHQNCCFGAYILEEEAVRTIHAKVTVLCTGGAGKVYLYTSNPDIATGDGIAMAFRAGAKIANMEFFQFHPTCLYHRQAKNFLISEAVRGEGAYLLDGKGKRFMKKYSPEKMELATRDTVARAIDKEMKVSGAECVFLDISHKSSAFLKERFPTIYSYCLELGLDITKKPFPVVPAAHYLCGGVLTDHFGRSSIKNLFCLGETACTGLHGGNRLASNSLLEAVVYAYRAYLVCRKQGIQETIPATVSVMVNDINKKKPLEERILVTHNWELLRKIMWNYVGIVRSDRRLILAEQRIQEIQSEIEQMYLEYQPVSELLELRNICTVSLLIIKAARARKESRGLHYTLDYPSSSSEFKKWNIFQKSENSTTITSSIDLVEQRVVR